MVLCPALPADIILHSGNPSTPIKVEKFKLLLRYASDVTRTFSDVREAQNRYSKLTKRFNSTKEQKNKVLAQMTFPKDPHA